MFRHAKVVVFLLAIFAGCHKHSRPIIKPSGPIQCAVETKTHNPLFEKNFVEIDNTLSDEEIKSIMTAMSDWSVATGTRVVFDEVKIVPEIQTKIQFTEDDALCESPSKDEPNLLVFRRIESNDPAVIEMDKALFQKFSDKRITLAFTRSMCQKTVVYIISSRSYSLGSVAVTALMRHEIGHVLGIDHHDELRGYSIMTSLLDDYPNCITKQDVELFCQRFDCAETSN